MALLSSNEVVLPLSLLLMLVLYVGCSSSTVCSNTCNPGEYLVLVNGNGTGQCVECPSGFYCEGSQSAPQSCLPGTANKITGQINSSACQPCQPGTYAGQSGSISCLSCPSGTACPNISTSAPTPCISGLYAVVSGDTGAINCTECPVGAKCPFSFSVPIPCPSGFYSNETESTNCTECPGGHRCPDPSFSPDPCNPGSFAAAGSVSCTQCPVGTSCPQAATTIPQDCSEGQYAINGSCNCSLCPVGHFCTDPSLVPTLCPSGTYNNVTGQLNCTLCEIGRQCLNGIQSLPCPVGTFSLELQVDCTPCNTGTYSTEGAGECIVCPPGHYCSSPASVPLPCQAGYIAVGGQDNCTLCDSGTIPDSTHSICTACPAGHYCPDPRQPPLPCSNGTYTLPGQNTQCIICPQGYACHVQDALPLLCSVGSYSPLGSVECLLCPAGAACSNGSLPMPCVSGEYSLQGDPLCTTCPSGSYCLTTYDLPSPCPSGTYSNESSITCILCPPGNHCPTTTNPPLSCPAGTYSVENATFCSLCEAGFSCLGPALEPLPCDHGYYSAAGDEVCTLCPAGFECPLTSRFPSPCPPGYVSDGGSTNCTVCPSGHSCPDTTTSVTMTPCTPGTYSPGGQVTCTSCPPGMYCPDACSAIEFPCEPGSFSLGNQTSCTPCPPGMACSASDGSSNLVCSSGTYSRVRSEICVSCPPGFACPLSDQALELPCVPGSFSTGVQTECTMCPAGMECPFVDRATMIDCSPGTYSLGNQSSCTQCPPGYECPSTTMDTRTQCPTGYYSPGSSASCFMCSRGFACPVPEATPTPCSPGTYSLDGSINCTLCDAGYTCQDPTILPLACSLGTWSQPASLICLPCNHGYQCLETSTTPTPLDQICPIGAWCDGQDLFLCPVGFYGNVTGAGSQEEGCTLCPPGYYCPNPGSISFDSNTCPEGYYCPAGTTFAQEFPCPAGTFNNRTMQTSVETGCTAICPASMYCPQGSSRGLECPAGFYCAEGTPTPYHTPCPLGTYGPGSSFHEASQCIECPVGHYCPSGNSSHSTVSPLPCRPGTYNPLNGTGHEFNCILCTAGMSCPTIALTEPSHTCNEGHYCPNGTIYPNQYPCPPGTVTFRIDLQSPEQCDICPAGQACGFATGFNFSEPLPCAPGHYCPMGTPAPNKYPCPSGTFTESSDLTSAIECSICPAGHYCIGGGGGPTDVCPRGHYCPEDTSLPHQFPCSKTTYNPLFGQNSTSSCLNCTIGHFCERGFATPEACPAGTYNPHGYDAVSDSTIGDPIGNKSDCLVCPGGQFCVEGSIFPVDCGLGLFSPPRSVFCFDCLVGHYCDENTTSEENMRVNKQCPPGNYCVAGLSDVAESVLCATGFYCPQGTPREFSCTPGTYNPLEGQSSLSDCLSCTAGYYCLENATLPTGPCQPGFYCPTNISNGQLSRNIGSYGPTQIPCPGGTYQDNFTSAELSDCVECPEGSFCVEGSANPAVCPMGFYCVAGLKAPIPCPVGTIGIDTGLVDVLQCVPCPTGQYCDSPGLTSPRAPCDPGFVCYLGANTSTPTDGSSGEICPAGGYCPLGSSVSLPCPPGTFSNTSGSTNTFDCTECTPGFYCSNARTPEPTGPCNAGYYCPGGAKTPNDTVTMAGHYTPVGSAAPIPCDVGTWMPRTAAGECYPCTPGHYCPDHGSTNVTLCLIGHYCEEGSFDPAPCPPGTYNNQTGISSLAECLSCPPGYFCASGGLTKPEGLCLAGFACFGNSNLPNPIESDEVTFGDLCMAGHFCPEGSGGGFPCPAGTFSSSRGLATERDCIPCPPGMHCNTSGLTAPSGMCDSGYFCIGGAIIGSPSDGEMGDACPIGHFCTVGTSIPIPCESGTYSNSTGFSVCLTCPPGHFCHLSSTTQPAICLAGFYCPGGNSLDYSACPISTLGTREGLADESQCISCPAGYYCNSDALTTPSGPCDPGYFCSSGSTNPRPLDSVANGPCPAGFYCPLNSSSPTPCPPGTYSPSMFNIEEGNCLLCDPGRHCNESGLTSPSGLCAEGYFCINGSSTSFPLNIPSGDTCPKGHFCLEGSSAPMQCLPGTYTNSTGSGVCSNCLAGFYCEGSTEDPALNPCPSGYYCPLGTRFAFEFPCPLSTYNPSTTSIDSSVCLMCPAGLFCNGTGLDAPSGICNAGSFCAPGSISPTGEPCEPGFYCPPDANSPLSCPPGMYCAGFANIAPTGLCNNGYYCISGASSPQPTDGMIGDVCPTGHYCTEGSINFTACPPGTFGQVLQARNESEGCELCPATMYCCDYGLSSPSGVCDGGYYCPPGQRVSNPFDFICPQGHFCTAGVLQPMRCVSGTYQDEIGQTDCKICPASFHCDNRFEPVVLLNNSICPQGYYCPNGTSFATEFPCPNGTFSNLTGLTDSTECTPCTPGHYCNQPGITETSGLCFAGYFCLSGSITPSPQDTMCPAGHYCPIGGTNPIPCPAGTYSASILNHNVTFCIACTPGHYCPQASVNGTALVCDPGFVCLFRAFVANPVDNVTGYSCPAGHFCVSGALSEETCLPRSYQPNAGQSECIVCPAGAICESIAQIHFTMCPPGHYCPTEGSTDGIACPIGSYSNSSGNTNVTDCLPCPSGMYCETTGLLSPTGTCSAGFVCVAGSASRAPFDGINTPCPAGFYCTEGTSNPQPCPLGTTAPFSNAIPANETSYLLEFVCELNTTLSPIPALRLESESDCVPCVGGFYCGYLNSTLPTGPCNSGYYCPHNSSISVPNPSDFACPLGHFCSEGTIIPTPCAKGSFSSLFGASNCTICPAGHICTIGTIEPEICPPQHFCPEGSFEPIFCPNGTFTNSETNGLSLPEQCTPCIPGHFCIAGAIVGECIAGYLCYQGSAVPNPDGTDLSVGELCPEGFYCLQGAVNGTSCPLGLFNVLRGGRQVEDCTDCPAGRMCSGSVATLCFPGFYCLSGTAMACPPSTYNPSEGASLISECISCEPGYLCPNESMVTFLHDPCPLGHYCLGGSITPTPCPQGTHRNETAAATSNDCYLCPAQFYCPDNATIHGIPCNVSDICLEGTVTPTPCPAGFYCPRTDLQLPCPSGYYCPEGLAWFIECPRDHYCEQPGCEGAFIIGAGAIRPEICPIGYREIVNLGDNFTRSSLYVTCEPCPGGTYSNASSLTEERICLTCPEGYYCVGGSIFGDPGILPFFNASICPAGHYCEAGSLSPSPCEMGMFNSLEGQSNSSVCMPCPLSSFSHLVGQRACFNCSIEASTIAEGSVECVCSGNNRRFQPSDGRCPCRAGFTQYEGRTAGDCQLIIYPLCGEDQIRSHDGVCRTLSEWEEFCTSLGCRSPELYVELDRNRGICVCRTQVLADVCNANCQQRNVNRLQIRCFAPPAAVVTDNNGNETLIALSDIPGLFSTDLCTSLDGRTFAAFTVDTAGKGFRGNYLPNPVSLVLLLSPPINQPANITTRRRRQATSNPANQPQFDGIDDPLVCLEVDQLLFFFLSNSSYPVYDETNLLNINADYDLGLFNQLVEDQLLTGDNLFFAFRFTQSGVFSFYLSDATERYMYVRVVEPSSQCPEVGPFYPASPSRAVQLGMVRSSNIIQDPNWALIGGLLGGGVAVMVGIVIALLLFRRYGWSKPVLHKPKYRKSNKRLNMAHYSSKGSSLVSKKRTHPMQELDRGGVAVSEVVRNDDFWDYDDQMDLEAFSTKQLYSKLADQSHHVVATIGGQKEEAKALYQKLQREADSLKGLWVAKLNLRGRAELASPEELRAYEVIRDKYYVELERRKALGQQFGNVLQQQLSLLQGLEDQRQQQRVGCDSIVMEIRTMLTWLRELKLSHSGSNAEEIERLDSHVGALFNQLKTIIDSQFGLTRVSQNNAGARLVSMETGQLVSVQQIQEALANSNESVAIRDVTTGLVKPGTSTKISLPSGSTKEVLPNNFIDLNTGSVLPIRGNVFFDPVSLKIVTMYNLPNTSPEKMQSLIPFIPYPLNAETSEALDIGLEPLEYASQLKLGGAMKDPTSDLCVPICAVTVHPHTKSLLPIGGTCSDPVTGLLVPIQIGAITIDSHTMKPVPILGIDIHPQTGKIVPIGGSTSLQGERKTLLVGENFIDPLSELPAIVASAALSTDEIELTPVAGNYQTFLDSTELDWQTRLFDNLTVLHTITETPPNEQHESQLAEKFEEVETIHSKLTRTQSISRAHSMKLLHDTQQRIDSCHELTQNGASPCYMEHKATGQPLPLLLGYPIVDPLDNTCVPVLDYEISSITGIGEPFAGTMESVDGGGRIPITVGSRMYNSEGGGLVPVVGAKRSSENGVVVPVPQDAAVFTGREGGRVDSGMVQLLEREMVSRGSYWRRSTQFMGDMTSHLETVCRYVQSSGADFDCESSRQQLQAVSMSSRELQLMSHAEKQRFQSCRSELVTKLCSGVHQLVTMPTEDELAATEVHTSANERFVEVAEKLIDRISNEKKSYQAKVQQAVEVNNPEAKRQLTQNRNDKMATLIGELKKQLLSQRQLLYKSHTLLHYLRSKTELSFQLAKSVLTGEDAMTGVGYSVAKGESEENGALVPLLEKLVQLVEQRGTEGLMDEGGDSESEEFAESSQTSLLSQSVRPHPVQLHSPTILEVIVEEVEPSQTPKVGWFEDKPSTMSSLGVPVMSPDLKRVAKQLIEKHTIENMTLENRLREKESTALKKLYTRIEERKAKLINDSKVGLEDALTTVEPQSNESVILEGMKELNDKLETLEVEKNEMIESIVARLVEERLKEKEKLIKAHHNEARDKSVSVSHLVTTPPPPSEHLLREMNLLAQQEERLRAEISLEMAREEEERVKKDEVLRAASLSRHIIRRLTSLDAGQDDLKQQHEGLNNLDITLSERQNNLKNRVSSIFKERGRSLGKNRSSASSIQQKANSALIQVAMSKIARKEGLKTKKIFGRDALISIGGNRPNFVEILDEYDQEGLGDDAVMTDVDRSEAIVAMKAAQWRLQLEIKKEKQQKEQLKLSLSKQVALGGYSDTVTSIPNVSMDTSVYQEKKQGLLDEQIKDQVEVDLKHRKELSALELESQDEQVDTLAKHSDETRQLIETSLRKKEADFKEQLVSQQLSLEESNKLISEHQREMAALRDNMKAEEDQQKKALSNKIAERKRKKGEKLEEKQKLEMDKLLLDQSTARKQLELEQKRDDEKETLDKLLKDKNPDKIESIVYQVLKQRHFEETVQLAAQYEREKELTVSEKISVVSSTRQEAKETLLAEQRKEMMEVVSNVRSLSNADLSKKKLELKKQHKKLLTEFDKTTQESIDKTTNKPNPEKELQYNSQVLALRERQIKELAQVISVYSPEQALVKSYEIEAERAAVEAERFRKDIIESRVKKFAILKEERRQKEEARKKEREAKLRELEAEIEHEKTKDVQRQEQLSERYQVMQEQRIAQQEAIHKRALDGNAGISEQERQKLIAEHKETMRKMLEGMEKEKRRQVDRLEGEIKRRRERKEQRRREQLEVEEAIAVHADDEEEQQRVDEVNTEEAKQLQVKLAQTRRPSTPMVVTLPTKNMAAPTRMESIPENIVSQVTLAVPQNVLAVPQSVLAVPQNVLSEESEITKLIMATPLFSQLTEIEKLLQTQMFSIGNPPPADNSTPYIDVRDAQWECNGELVPTEVQSLQPVDFVVYRFGLFCSKLLHIQNHLPEVTILIASNLPPNNYARNCFRKSSYYEHSTRILYIRKERLESIGEFVLVVLHCLAHLKCGDITDDTNPLFLREFYSAIRTICQELFLSRAIQPIVGGERRSLETIVGRATSWEDRERTVRELVDLEVPSQKTEEEVSERVTTHYRRVSSSDGTTVTGVVVPNSNWLEV